MRTTNRNRLGAACPTGGESKQPPSEAAEPSILQLGDPRLRRHAVPVTNFTRGEFVYGHSRLHAALDRFRARHGFGRAIAAPQIGVNLRFVACDLGAGAFTLVNPRITWRSNADFELWDDCMSFPELLVRVRRNCSISVEFTDQHGQAQRMSNLGRAEAELFQHEFDHLDGVLAVDRRVDADSIVSRAAFDLAPERYQSMLRS